jgi:nucleotide-binding universal stress UspA family protein
MGFQRILVAIDRSPVAAMVVEETLKLAFTYDSNLMLLHCFTSQTWEEFYLTIDTAFGLSGKQKLNQLQHKYEQEMEQTRQWMQTYCKQSIAHGVSTEYYCPVGEPSSQICEFAQNWCADLIVLGRRNRRKLIEILQGRVSDRVVHHASCSVLIIQEPRVFGFQNNHQLLRRQNVPNSRGLFFPAKRSLRLAEVS